jgi:hypothetical protein
MYLPAYLWVSLLHTLVLLVAVALNVETQYGLGWLQDLPWAYFLTECGGVLAMQPVGAGALWALWLVCAALHLVLSIGFALLGGMDQRQRGRAAASPAHSQTHIDAMFNRLSEEMTGLQSFGAVQQSPGAVFAQRLPQEPPVKPRPATETELQESLQNIDPDLGSIYDQLVLSLRATQAKSK